MKLIEIKKDNFDVIIDLKYASADNILGKKIFNENKCFLLEEAAKKLCNAINIAKDLGFFLKIFDAYRPSYVQQALWDFIHNPDFLSNPNKGSPHTRGVAIDLTLTDLNENELNMGTNFDDFTNNAYHLSKNTTKEVKINRYLLLSIMTLAGFDFYHKEWWHYQLFNASSYPIINNFFKHE
jgi:D-alanyl-D-alanine dipeptidase